jgi:hypothetical protein
MAVVWMMRDAVSCRWPGKPEKAPLDVKPRTSDRVRRGVVEARLQQGQSRGSMDSTSTARQAC